MSIPSIRVFQLDASAIGDAAKSVNLFRGNMLLHHLPLRSENLFNAWSQAKPGTGTKT